MNIDQNAFVAFYHKGELLIGIVTEKQDNLYWVKASGQSHLLSSARFVLQSKLATNQSLDSFLEDVNCAQNSFSPGDFGLLPPQELSLAVIAQMLELKSDADMFGLYSYLKGAPQLFLHKKDLFRLKTAAEQAAYRQLLQSELARQQYLTGLEAYLKGDILSQETQLQLFTELPNALSERKYRDLFSIIQKAYPELNPETALIAFRKKCGELPRDIDPIIAASDLPVGFPDLLNLQNLVTPDIPSHTGTEAFCIDDEDTRDFDDAISLTKDGAFWKLGIHVSCVAQRFTLDSLLFAEAERRVSSLYTANYVISMFPPAFAETEFSLLKGTIRPVLSLYVWLDEANAVQHRELMFDSISVQHNFSYLHVDKHLQHEPFATLNRIAQSLEKARESITSSNKHSYYYVKEKSGRLTLKLVNANSPSRLMIEELMIQYNSSVAAYADTNGLPMIYRNIQQFKSGQDTFPASQAYLSTQAQFHPGIGAAAYLHASSPIRRYADLINQWQVLASLQNLPVPFDTDTLESKIVHIEKQLYHLKEIGHQSERYWWLMYIEQNCLNTPLEAAFRAANHGVLRVELLQWGVQVLTKCDVYPNQEQFTIVFYKMDWKEGVLLGDIL